MVVAHGQQVDTLRRDDRLLLLFLDASDRILDHDCFPRLGILDRFHVQSACTQPRNRLDDGLMGGLLENRKQKQLGGGSGVGQNDAAVVALFARELETFDVRVRCLDEVFPCLLLIICGIVGGIIRIMLRKWLRDIELGALSGRTGRNFHIT